jgi:hypothetical protein
MELPLYVQRCVDDLMFEEYCLMEMDLTKENLSVDLQCFD